LCARNIEVGRAGGRKISQEVGITGSLRQTPHGSDSKGEKEKIQETLRRKSI
jgi:hypothetical protein